jgi:hypothetical protein
VLPANDRCRSIQWIAPQPSRLLPKPNRFRAVPNEDRVGFDRFDKTVRALGEARSAFP